MATIMTKPATSARWADVQHALTGGGDGASCQCAWMVLRDKDFHKTSTEERNEMLRAEIVAGAPPGLIAYVDSVAAGWVRVGPRIRQNRVIHTRAIVAASNVALDDETIWAITCFVARREYRGLGVTTQLLRDAVEFAQRSGARVIEAYPVDTSTGKHSPNDLYHGALSTFLSAGFNISGELRPGRPIVSLDVCR